MSKRWKAEIVKVGTIENGVATGWHFNGHGGGIAADLTDPEGGIRACGYTLDELKAILEQPPEQRDLRGSYRARTQ